MSTSTRPGSKGFLRRLLTAAKRRLTLCDDDFAGLDNDRRARWGARQDLAVGRPDTTARELRREGILPQVTLPAAPPLAPRQGDGAGARPRANSGA